jgi:glutamyl-tRNA synthetase
MTVRTRFAPSPTGYMHIGNLRTALYEYLLARSSGGKFILRIEDTDQERFVEGSIDVIYNTLKLVGLEHDEGPDIGGPYGPYVQSERKPIYLEYAKKLVELGGAYYCFCSKERLDNLRQDCEARQVPFAYDGVCRGLSRDEVAKRLAAGESYVIRQRISEGQISFDDAVFGTITVENVTLDEGVLLKSDGMPTYNFANIVDDHLMKITHVIRGSEYLPSTPKYNLIYKSFGWDIPTYIHLPLIMKAGGQKLSKRSGDASFEDYYNQGYLVGAIVNYITLLGWNPGTEEEFFTLNDLKQRFSIAGLSKSAAIFDPLKLRWMNGEYLRRMGLEQFHALALPYYNQVISKPEINLLTLSKVLQIRTEVLGEIPAQIGFIQELNEGYDPQLFVHQKMKTDLPGSLDALRQIYPILEALPSWTEESIKAALLGLVEQLGVKNGWLMWPVRIALAGQEVTPGGAVEIAELLGKDEALRRLRVGIEKLEKVV